MSFEIWLAIAAVLLVLEAVTVGLVCIWFAVGAVAAFLVSLVVKSIYIQVAVFIIVSIASFACLRPFLKKYMHVNNDTNSTSRLVGKKAIVTEEITDIGGRVRVGDILWLAESADGSLIEKDSMVKIKESRSNRLVVEKI